MPYLRGEDLRDLLGQVNDNAEALRDVFNLDNEYPVEIEQLSREIREDLQRQVDFQIGVLLCHEYNGERFRGLRLKIARRIYSRLEHTPHTESWQWPGINIPIEINPTATLRFPGDDFLEEEGLVQWCLSLDDDDGTDGPGSFDDACEGVFAIDMDLDDPYDHPISRPRSTSHCRR